MMETIRGEIPVSTRLALGSERLHIIFTSNRLLIDHVGKRGTGMVAGASLFGMLSGAIEDLFKSGRESVKKHRSEKRGPDQILRSHKDNFAITQDEIVSITLNRTRTTTRISILTGDDKYEFASPTSFDNILRLFKEMVGDKLIVQSST